MMSMRLSPLTALLAAASFAESVPTGPAVGARVPDFTAVDQFGKSHSLDNLRGPKGTMLVFYRSADW